MTNSDTRPDSVGQAHTPGPWSVDVIDKGRDAHILGAPNGFCCDIVGTIDLTSPEGEANARFIVHAVNCHDELLAALKAARAQVIACHLTAGLNLDIAIANINPKIDAAIAKATGGQS